MLTEEFIVIIRELVDKGLIDLQKLMVNISNRTDTNELKESDKIILDYLNSKVTINNGAFGTFLNNRSISDVLATKTLDNCVEQGAYSYLTTKEKKYYLKTDKPVTSDMIVRR